MDATDQDRPPDLWVQLRNHALQYVGIGWFLTQVFGVSARNFGWPPQFGDWLVMALGAGFIGVMVGSFVLGRRVPGAAVRRRRRGFWIAGVAAGAALLIWLAQGPPEAGPSGVVSESRGLFSTSTDVDAFFVVHPQEPLLSTGVFVARGKTLSVWGEGRINIALARLVEAAQAGEDFTYEWVGPPGEVDARGLPLLRQDRGRPGRERCLLNASAPYGALMVILAPSDRIAPSTVRSLAADREVFVVGSHVETTTQTSGYVTLAVNDVYLDREECDPEEFTAGRDPGAHYTDNIGFFTARIQVR